MKICSWNVNGIRAVMRKDVLAPFVVEANPDVLCLQETKAQEGEVSLALDGYREYWHSAEKKGYSGVAIVSKTEPLSLNNKFPEEIAAKFDLGADDYGDPTAEGRVMTAEFEKLYLVTVYTPNAKEDLTRLQLRHKKWDPAFLAYCQSLEKLKPVVFCGDLNVAHMEQDLANPGPNRGKKGFTNEEREGFQAFVDAGYTDTFRMFTEGNGHYTWWSAMGGARSRNVGWRIDYFMVSAPLKNNVTSASIHADVIGSDHCPVSVELNI